MGPQEMIEDGVRRLKEAADDYDEATGRMRAERNAARADLAAVRAAVATLQEQNRSMLALIENCGSAADYEPEPGSENADAGLVEHIETLRSERDKRAVERSKSELLYAARDLLQSCGRVPR